MVRSLDGEVSDLGQEGVGALGEDHMWLVVGKGPDCERKWKRNTDKQTFEFAFIHLLIGEHVPFVRESSRKNSKYAKSLKAAQILIGKSKW